MRLTSPRFSATVPPPSKRAAPHSAGQQGVVDWLLLANGFATVLQKAHGLTQLESVLAEYVPAALRPCTRVAGLKHEGEQVSLHILAENAAVATRLRQSAPSVLRALQMREWKINAIRVRVQPGLQSSLEATNATPYPKTAHFSGAAVQAMSALHQQLEDSPLRTAVAQLLQRHAQKD